MIFSINWSFLLTANKMITNQLMHFWNIKRNAMVTVKILTKNVLWCAIPYHQNEIKEKLMNRTYNDFAKMVFQYFFESIMLYFLEIILIDKLIKF